MKSSRPSNMQRFAFSKFIGLTSLYLGPLKSDSHLPKKTVLFAWLKALSNVEKKKLFQLKSSFRSQDIKVFTFLSQLFGHVGKTASLER